MSRTIDDVRSWLSSLRAPLGAGDVAGVFNLVRQAARRSREPIPVTVGSTRMFVRPCTADLAVARSCLSGEFDPAIAAARPLQHGLVIDAGGYIGAGAIAFARAFPDATVVTLEPSHDNFAILAMNVRAWPNIVALNMALGATAGSCQLPNRGTGEVGFSIVQTPADSASPVRLHDVAVTTVPDLMRR